MKVLATAAVAFVALGSMTACGDDSKSGTSDNGSAPAGKKNVRVGLAFDIGGRGDKSFNDSAAAGLDKVKSDLNIEVKDLAAVAGESENDKYSRLKLLCDSGYNPVIAVGFVYDGADAANGPLAKAAKDCPNTKFAIVDGATKADNVADLTFAEEQGSYLVGVAAALKSTKGTVGFIGGCQVDLIKKFEAGFTAGAKSVKADIKVLSNYLSTPAEACKGFNDPAGGKTAASGMYDQGADIVYAAAGGSGTGVFEAAKAKNALAIGVDSDQYNTVTDASLKPVIMTSMLKRVDNAVFNFVKDYAAGNFKGGATVFDLKADGVGYATSGGKVDDIKDKLDAAKADIVSGKVTVPTK
ncbi:MULTISPECIES: BMP family lipoprotein [Dactylosporangium]|nr:MULTISPECIES: BMP family ABC transporter substrate-binding protein [Dactylosporangium]UAB97468.1 BMP family ABC transporter substrate-binding protein [Dactylosporangium vinaceum]UWZ45733.1 BMP family ABC transporter substrate-binding protein [Dactylosporangium matsuzakiense]